MAITVQVLSEADKTQVHERTLKILERNGVRVDTKIGREYLRNAGAEVDENTKVVRFPRSVVEASLKQCPRQFLLGARRPGCDLEMNAGECTLLIDGSAMSVLNRKINEREPGTYEHWLNATRLIDTIDEIGVYWHMLVDGTAESSIDSHFQYWRDLFSSFSKHIQDGILDSTYAPWYKEVLQVVFGDSATIRQKHPISFLLNPQSPLVIEGPYTDAYLAMVGWGIPVAIMPMPLMGASAPGNLISTLLLANCEVLSTLCLVQAAEPGSPVIYAPTLASINPRTGMYAGGAIEQGLMNTVGIEMGRYYGLPVLGSGMGSGFYSPGIQSTYEGALNAVLPLLAWPDILVGPGSLGSSTIFSYEKVIIVVEVYRLIRRLHAGIQTDESMWLDDVIQNVKAGGDYLGQQTTKEFMHSEEWLKPGLGTHSSYNGWVKDGQPDVLAEASEKVNQLLANHKPHPLSEEAERELDRIQTRVKMEAK
jgi:trimethylamine--corrinoid protein Co-methyltransferase